MKTTLDVAGLGRERDTKKAEVVGEGTGQEQDKADDSEGR